MHALKPHMAADREHINLPEHDAALAAVPAPVGELHGKVLDGLSRVEGQGLILAVCMCIGTRSQGKIAQAKVLLGAAAAEVSQLARQACSTRTAAGVMNEALTSGGSRKGKAQVCARWVIDGPWGPRDERNRCTRSGHRLQTSTRGGKSHFGWVGRGLSLAVSHAWKLPGSGLPSGREGRTRNLRSLKLLQIEHTITVLRTTGGATHGDEDEL
jgi:hypothetical protein